MEDSDSEDDLPPCWEERVTIDGNIYYVNHLTKTTQWFHPRTGVKKCVSEELPFEWKKIVDTSGKILYKHESKDITTHTDPRLAFPHELKKYVDRVRYKFDGSSTALEVLNGLNLSNKIALITGANTGIGFETAYSLAMHNCCVVFGCRSINAAEEAVSKIKARRNNANCTIIELNLSSLKSVKQFAAEFKKKFNRLDILILNAGVFALPYTLTEDGYESTFQICHLSHFYLTKLLEPEILNASFPRIIVVSSESHRYSNLTERNLSEAVLSPPYNKYRSLMAYNNVKLCNILFANQLHMRLYTKGVNVYSVHPGNLVYSNIWRNWWFYKVLFYICRPFTKSLQQAASTSVFCATSAVLDKISGIYYNNCFPCEPSKSAMNYILSQKLWQMSEELIRKVLEKIE
ncbi:hypothetical protein PGB90_005846 [Kerria lacca]